MKKLAFLSSILLLSLSGLSFAEYDPPEPEEETGDIKYIPSVADNNDPPDTEPLTNPSEETEDVK